MSGFKSINEPDDLARQSFSPVSPNEPPSTDDLVVPVVTALEPAGCAIGDPSFTLIVRGSGFTAKSVIHFAGFNEPTTMEGDGSLSTGVNMDVWHGADTVKVSVNNGLTPSNELDFTFAPAPVADTESADDHPHDERGHVRHGHHVTHRRR